MQIYAQLGHFPSKIQRIAHGFEFWALPRGSVLGVWHCSKGRVTLQGLRVRVRRVRVRVRKFKLSKTLLTLYTLDFVLI